MCPVLSITTFGFSISSPMLILPLASMLLDVILPLVEKLPLALTSPKNKFVEPRDSRFTVPPNISNPPKDGY